MKDGTLFDTVMTQAGERYEIRPHFADRKDVPRLTRQNARLLAMLRAGPVRNCDMITIALNYRARISEIRSYLEHRYGQTVVCEAGAGGVNVYRIVDAKCRQDIGKGAMDGCDTKHAKAQRPGR